MVKLTKAPPEWEVQVTRDVGGRLEIETFGPLPFSRALVVARQQQGDRETADKCVELNRVTDQQESIQW